MADVSKWYARWCRILWSEWRGRHLHQETCLSAGTVANDDELASDFSHAVPVYTSARLAGKEVQQYILRIWECAESARLERALSVE